MGVYLAHTAPERAQESPHVEWPRGLVTLIGRGCVSWELCDFVRPPYPVHLLDGDKWDLDRPVIEALIPVATSLADRLEQWLAT